MKNKLPYILIGTVFITVSAFIYFILTLNGNANNLNNKNALTENKNNTIINQNSSININTTQNGIPGVTVSSKDVLITKDPAKDLSTIPSGSIKFFKEKISNGKGVEVIYPLDWVASQSDSLLKLMHKDLTNNILRNDPRTGNPVPSIYETLASYFNYVDQEIATGKVSGSDNILKELKNLYNNAYTNNIGVLVPQSSSEKNSNLKATDPQLSYFYEFWDGKNNQTTYCLVDGRYLGYLGDYPGAYQHFLVMDNCKDFIDQFRATHQNSSNNIK